MILINLQKAFNTINHEILLKNMPALRFTDRSMNWFKLYRSNRSFRVNVHCKYSCIVKIDRGLSQGFLLGSLLFLLYDKDMKQAVNCEIEK